MDVGGERADSGEGVAAEQTGTLEAALAHATRLLSREPALAVAQAQEILDAVPGEPRALLLLGCAHCERGDAHAALVAFDRLVSEHPRWALAHAERARALGIAGRGDEAIAALRQALALKPEMPKAWLALADHLGAIGDQAGADAAHARHIRCSVRDPEMVAAADALLGDRLPEAERRLREHLKRAPTDVVALRMLAELAARLGRYDDAEALLARCLDLAPAFREARQNYAQVLQRANRHPEALAEIDALLELEPANPLYRNLKAVILCRVGEYEPAIVLYDALLAEYPGHAKVWLSFGHALRTAGHQQRAIAAYRKAIELDPGYGEPYWSLANLKTFRFTPEEVETMRAKLAAGLDAQQRCELEFALGKALEDAREYEASFRHYDNGNRLRVELVPYSAKETTRRLARARGTYTREFFAAREGYGTAASDPIFIVGLPRSGSTLIEQILSSHSQVEGTMELPEITSLTRDLRQQSPSPDAPNYHEVLATLVPDAVRALGESYLERTRIHRKTGAPRFIDKMPNNFAHVGLIHLCLPNARIIDARRHPMACCFSGFKQHFARGQSFSYRLEDLARYYRDYVELMAHFDAVLPGRVHRVIYERMVDDTEAEVRRLLDYCGLPFEPGCLRFFENERPVRTASSEQVRQPIFREGLEHWRHYEPWLGPLRDALGPLLDRYPDIPEFQEAENT